MKEAVKTKEELNELNKALLNAVNTAAMLDDTEDGGTCNFDSVTLKNQHPGEARRASMGKARKDVSPRLGEVVARLLHG